VSILGVSSLRGALQIYNRQMDNWLMFFLAEVTLQSMVITRVWRRERNKGWHGILHRGIDLNLSRSRLYSIGVTHGLASGGYGRMIYVLNPLTIKYVFILKY